MSEKTGGPAFPFTGDWEGMTLRDYFAAKAMQAAIERQVKINGDPWVGSSWDAIAAQSYEFADAMLRAREVKP